jgi:nucleoside-diphosphate-sugar epimerase
MSDVFNPSLLREDLEHVLRWSEPDFRKLKGARIFVTGGTGFFGHWMLETLLYANERLSLNAHCTVLTRNPATFMKSAPQIALNPRITLIEGDIRNFSYPDGKFSHCLHMAAPTIETARVDIRGFIPLFQEFYEGALRVLEFARQSGVHRFLEVSSGAVYGKQPESLDRISESFSGAPDLVEFRSGLGEGKRVSEYLTLTYGKAYSFDSTVARCFSFFGPYLPFEWYAVGNFVNDAINKRPILIEGDGKPVRSYLYAADLAVWLWAILVRGTPNEIYNVGSEEPTSLREIAQIIGNAQVPASRVEVRGDLSRVNQRNIYVPSTAKARETLGLKQHLSLEEGAHRTLNFYHSRS